MKALESARPSMFLVTPTTPSGYESRGRRLSSSGFVYGLSQTLRPSFAINSSPPIPLVDSLSRTTFGKCTRALSNLDSFDLMVQLKKGRPVRSVYLFTPSVKYKKGDGPIWRTSRWKVVDVKRLGCGGFNTAWISDAVWQFRFSPYLSHMLSWALLVLWSELVMHQESRRIFEPWILFSRIWNA